MLFCECGRRAGTKCAVCASIVCSRHAEEFGLLGTLPLSSSTVEIRYRPVETYTAKISQHVYGRPFESLAGRMVCSKCFKRGTDAFDEMWRAKVSELKQRREMCQMSDDCYELAKWRCDVCGIALCHMDVLRCEDCGSRFCAPNRGGDLAGAVAFSAYSREGYGRGPGCFRLHYHKGLLSPPGGGATWTSEDYTYEDFMQWDRDRKGGS
jgi:hypothetical protein